MNPTKNMNFSQKIFIFLNGFLNFYFLFPKLAKYFFY
jgi:hypothetical protein